MASTRTALVTGASSGIGRATTVELARRGYTVFAAARNGTALKQLAGEVTGIHPVTIDVSDPDSVREGWSTIDRLTDGNGVDVLVNNAGFALYGPIEQLHPDDLHRQFATNVYGLVHMTRAALPGMRSRRSGRIVNISSVLGRFTFPGAGAYGATKYAVESLSDALRLEVAGFGIEVIVIEPGFTATNISHSADAVPADGPADRDGAYVGLVRGTKAYMTAQMAKAVPAERVATVIADAVQRRRPRTRYIVPGRTRTVVSLLTTLPDRAADRAKRRTMRLP
jgi:short-subunit dehydrogenase